MCGFEGFEFSEESVVFCVRDFRLSLVVIKPVVVLQLSPQFADSVLWAGGLGKKIRLNHTRSVDLKGDFSRSGFDRMGEMIP